MYFPPEKFYCDKCKSSDSWSVHHDKIGLQIPFCYNCYVSFIKDNVPIMERIK